MNRFKGIVKLSQAQYDTLKEQGSITIKGKTFLYDPTNTIYVTKDSSVTANKVTSVNGETGDVVITPEMIGAVPQIITDIGGCQNGIHNSEYGIDIRGSKIVLGGPGNNPVTEPFLGAKLEGTDWRISTNMASSNYIPNVIDISTNEINITGFNVKIDNDRVATLKDIQNGSSNGIIELVGTEDEPINLYSDLEVGKLYFLKGYVLVGNSYGSRDFSTNNVLVYKQDIDSVKVNAWVSHAMGPYFSQGSETNITVDETGYWTSVSTSVGVKSVNNVTSVYPINLYAPTTAGSQGQILQSNGSNKAPTWADLPSGGIETLVGTEETPINLATDLEKGKYYFIEGHVVDTAYDTRNWTTKRLCYKVSDTHVAFYNTNRQYPGSFAVGQTWLMGFDSSTGYIKENITKKVAAVGGINDVASSEPIKIYAPTKAGNAGQILSSGANTSYKEPQWIDMPEIPSIEGLATEEYVNNAIGNLTSINFTPVTGLPTENISTTTIYLLPIEGDTNNTYEEYIYVNDAWEKIGTTSVDLSGYATTAQLEEVTNTTSTALQPEDAATTSDIDALFEVESPAEPNPENP